MKQKYTLNIADLQISVISDAPAEEVEKVGMILDRKMREIYLKSRCPKTEAALLCALDYCADKFRAQRRVKTLEAELTFAAANIERLKADLEKANARLRACGQRTVDSSVEEKK